MQRVVVLVGTRLQRMELKPVVLVAAVEMGKLAALTSQARGFMGRGVQVVAVLAAVAVALERNH